MKIPLSWLKTFLPLTQSPEEIADTLTLAGLEVDAIERTPFTFEGVVYGKVLATKPHPDAEKLKVATVTDGTQEFQVVCGAPNCREGLFVAFAKIGAKLSDDQGKVFKIKKSKLRGVESFGMLCSKSELGLSLEHDGIAEFEADVPLGVELTTHLADVIFEISLTPNLGHCTSLLGIARELSALLDLKLTLPTFDVKEMGDKGDIDARVDDPLLCPRYMARCIRNVKVGPSPREIVERLEACGIRSINNVVDVTNYVMLELGQPLHAFDQAKLKGSTLIVEPAKKPLTFRTLDNEERTVKQGLLTIADAAGPVAIAGVIGGMESSVDESTQNIVLEAALFDASCVRRSIKALSLRTESAGRFEKGIDPNMTPIALDRAAHLLAKIAGGEVAPTAIDVSAGAIIPKRIDLRTERVNKLLGTKLSENEIAALLNRLSFAYFRVNGSFTVEVPTYRNDISHEIDLLEEVARIYGFNNIEKSAPKVTISSLPHSPMFLFENRIRQIVSKLGLQEFLTCDLISPKLAKIGFDVGETIAVLQPSSVEESILRPSLLPGHLKAIKHNHNHRTFDIAAFEIGRVHFKHNDNYTEPHVLALTLTGLRAPHHFSDKGQRVDFYDLKGAIESLFEQLGLKDLQITPSSHAPFHPNIQADIACCGKRLGAMGSVHPQTAAQVGIDTPVFFAEIDLSELLPLCTQEVQMTPLPQYPGSSRDLTVTIAAKTPLSQIMDAIATIKSPHLKKVDVIDLFDKGNGENNLTLRFHYRKDNGTIESKSVEALHAKVITRITEKIEGTKP